jgi:hypothetical protein
MRARAMPCSCHAASSTDSRSVQDTASLLQAFTPGGLEAAFRSLSEPAQADELPPAPGAPPPAETVEAMTARFAAHGVDFTGPPLAAPVG